MSESLENGRKGISRRGFLKGAAAATGMVAVNKLGLDRVQAAEANIESQESKIPSAEEIKETTRATLSSYKAPEDFSESLKASAQRDDFLRSKYYGEQDMKSGFNAYFEDIKPFLESFRNRNFEKEPAFSIANQKISEAEQLIDERDAAAAAFIRASREYISAMEDFLKVEEAASVTQKAKQALQSLREVTEAVGMKSSEEQASNSEARAGERIEGPDAELVRRTALGLARANDKLLQLRTKLVQSH